MNAQNPDHYAILGVSKQATQADLDHALRKAKLKYQTASAMGDKKEANHAWKLAQEAHALLSDTTARMVYDAQQKKESAAAKNDAAPPNDPPKEDPREKLRKQRLNTVIEGMNRLVKTWNEYLAYRDSISTRLDLANRNYAAMNTVFFAWGQEWNGSLLVPAFKKVTHPDPAFIAIEDRANQATALRVEAYRVFETQIAAFDAEDPQIQTTILDTRDDIDDYIHKKKIINFADTEKTINTVKDALAKRDGVLTNTLAVMEGRSQTLKFNIRGTQIHP